MRRRTFLKSASAVPLAGASQTFPSRGIKLGFDSYSIRAYKWKAFRLLDYAASLKLDTIQCSSLDDFESLEPEYLARVKERARVLGVDIDGGAGCVCSSSASYSPARQGEPRDYLVKALKTAHAVGARVMRCYMGAAADRRGKTPLEAHMENTVKAFRSVRTEALDLDVKIALENHAGDMQAREVKTIIEESGADFVGACLDTGNPVWVAEDPLVTLETLAPHVLTTHVRDSAIYEHPRGAAVQWVSLGDGCIDLAKFVERFRQLCPQSSMQLEIITGRAPIVLSYYEPDYWSAFPSMPAWEFARFAALAKNGRPYAGPMFIPAEGPMPPEIEDALRLQQKLDLERSFEYAKKKLGIGIRWQQA